MIPDFVTSLSRHGDRPALILTDRAPVSYADLAACAARFAFRLGQGARRLVAIEAVASVEMVAAYLGALAGGHAVALLPAGDRAAMDRFRRDFTPDAVWSRLAGRWSLVMVARPRYGLHPVLALVLMCALLAFSRGMVAEVVSVAAWAGAAVAAWLGPDAMRWILGLGGRFDFTNDWSFGLEYRGQVGSRGESDNGVLLNVQKSY